MVERQTNDPLNYLGVKAPTPPDLIRAQRDPLSTDAGFDLGTEWLNESSGTFFKLSSVAAGVATWDPFAGGAAGVDTLTGDSGGAISPAAGNITLAGGTNLTSAGTGSTVTFNMDSTIAIDTLEVSGGAATDFVGQATLVAGTVTVANSAITAADRVFVTRSDINSSTALGVLEVVITASTNFVINSRDPADATIETSDVSIIDYFIVRQV